jgi:hypothetical protein
LYAFARIRATYAHEIDFTIAAAIDDTGPEENIDIPIRNGSSASITSVGTIAIVKK